MTSPFNIFLSFVFFFDKTKKIGHTFTTNLRLSKLGANVATVEQPHKYKITPCVMAIAVFLYLCRLLCNDW